MNIFQKMSIFQKLFQKETFDSDQETLAKIKSGEFAKPISSKTNEDIGNLLNPEESQESNETQKFFNEQIKLEEWKTKYLFWYKKNADKIISHSDGLECKIEGLEGKKIQRENLKPEPNGTTITKIPEEELEYLSSELQEKLKDEVYLNFNNAQEEAKKIGMRPLSSTEWDILIDFMPGENTDEKYINLREFLDLPFAGYSNRSYGVYYYQGTNGCYWSSTANNNTDARYRFFSSSGGDCSSTNNSEGFSIRCIKD